MKNIIILGLLLAMGQSYAMAQGYELIVKKNGTNKVKDRTTDVSRNKWSKRYYLICADGTKFYTNYRNNYMNDQYEVWGRGSSSRKVCNITIRNNL